MSVKSVKVSNVSLGASESVGPPSVSEAGGAGMDRRPSCGSGSTDSTVGVTAIPVVGGAGRHDDREATPSVVVPDDGEAGGGRRAGVPAQGSSGSLAAGGGGPNEVQDEVAGTSMAVALDTVAGGGRRGLVLRDLSGSSLSVGRVALPGEIAFRDSSIISVSDRRSPGVDIDTRLLNAGGPRHRAVIAGGSCPIFPRNVRMRRESDYQAPTRFWFDPPLDFSDIDVPSVVTPNDLEAFFRDEGLAPIEGVCAPAEGSVPSRPLVGMVAVPLQSIRLGFTLPIPPLLERLLVSSNLHPIQISPDACRFIAGCYSLWREERGCELSADQFFQFFMLRLYWGTQGFENWCVLDSNQGLSIVGLHQYSDPNWHNRWVWVPSTYLGSVPRRLVSPPPRSRPTLGSYDFGSLFMERSITPALFAPYLERSAWIRSGWIPTECLLLPRWNLLKGPQLSHGMAGENDVVDDVGRQPAHDTQESHGRRTPRMSSGGAERRPLRGTVSRGKTPYSTPGASPSRAAPPPGGSSRTLYEPSVFEFAPPMGELCSAGLVPPPISSLFASGGPGFSGPVRDLRVEGVLLQEIASLRARVASLERENQEYRSRTEISQNGMTTALRLLQEAQGATSGSWAGWPGGPRSSTRLLRR